MSKSVENDYLNNLKGIEFFKIRCIAHIVNILSIAQPTVNDVQCREPMS